MRKSMWKALIEGVMKNCPTKVYRVPGKETPLFYRSYLFSLFGWVVYLHKYMQSDPDRGLHSHPFKAVALVLSGGYYEDRLLGLDEDGMIVYTRRLNPGALNFISPHCFHRLSISKVPIQKDNNTLYVQPHSYSLFLCKYLPKKSWGFLSEYSVLAKSKDMCHFQFRNAETPREKYWWKTAPKGKHIIK